jgi:DNA-binding SARP family transcriptional activator
MHFRILGPVDVTDGDRPLSITARRERAVLLRLLMEPGRPLGPERLVDDLWGDDPPADGRGSLRVLVARLRRRLAEHEDEPRILTGPAGYELRLSVDDELDASRFDALVARGRTELESADPQAAAATLRAALALWRGPALGDLADLAFARPEAVRLDEGHLAALELRIEADLACGHALEVAAELEAICAAHPLREGFWASRMVALYRGGRQADALRAYQELRRVLADEVGLEPTPALARLEASILSGDLHEGEALPHPTAPGRPAPDPPGDDRAPFVGRQEELGQLEAAWEAAAAGSRRLVLLRGEPGAGKSRLAEQLAARLPAGALTLDGRFDEEMLLPYQGVVEALLQLGPAATAGLGPLAPGADGTPALAGHGAGDLERHRFFAAVEDAIERAAGQAPLLLLLDDLHWADASSLLLLKQLTRSRSAVPCLLVATYRDTELHDDHPLTAALSSLRRARNVLELSVGPLGVTDVTDLVAARLGVDEHQAEAVAAAIVLRTGGHALFSEALVDAMADPARDPVTRQALDVPTTVREFVAASVSRLSRPARARLAVGAAHGTSFPLLPIVRASSLDEDAAVDGIDECTRSGFLVEADAGAGAATLRFAHNLVRDVVYTNLPQVRRAQLHQRLADALEGRGPSPEARAGEVARHLALAPPTQANLRRRVDHARLAGESALHKVAFDTAAELLLDAVEAHAALAGPEGDDRAERVELLLLAAKALVLTGRPARATELCQEAIDLAAAGGGAALLAQGALVLEEASWTGYGFMAAATAGSVAAVLRQALAALAGDDTDAANALQAELLARLPRVLHFGTSPEHRLPLAEEAMARAEASGQPRLRGAALEGMRWALWGSVDVARLAEVSERILDEAELAGDDALAVRGQVWRYLARLDLGDLAGAGDAMAALRQGAETLPEPLALWYPEVADAALALLDGRLEAAETSALAAFAVARRLDLAWAVETFGIQLQQIRREQGRLAELEEATLAVAAAHEGEPVWQLALADLHLQLRRTDEARALLRALVPAMPHLPQDLTRLAALALAADLAADLADEAAAEELYPLLLPHGDQLAVVGPGVVCLGSVARQLGALAGMLGLWEVAELHLDAAEGRNGTLAARPWLARTHLARAAALARQGQAAPAAACLAEARSLATSLGSPQLLASCDRLAV